MRSRLVRPVAAAALGVLLLAVERPSRSVDPMPVAVLGHKEVALENGHPVPIALGETSLGLCLGVPATADSHAWLGRLDLAGWRSDELEPSARLTGTVCFETRLEAGAVPDGEHRLCLEVRDRVDGRQLRPPCRRVRYRAEWPGTLELGRRLEVAMGGEDPVAELEDLASEAEERGLPLMALQARLVSLHHLTRRGDVASLEEARRRLDAMPAWLEDGAAARWSGMVAYQRARLLETLGEHGEAWRELDAADRALTRIADPRWLGVAMRQVGLLADQGAVREAVERLRAALEECQLAPCHKPLVRHARGQLAWRLSQLAGTAEEDLDRAAAGLEEVIQALGDDPVERANHLVNLAFIHLRSGHAQEALEALAEARLALGEVEEASERTRSLFEWGELVAAQADLAGGDLAAAARRCGELAASEDSELAAWSAACAARAWRRLGEVERAAELFDLALLHHEHRRLGEGRTQLPMGPGERADVFYRAARLEAERGDAGEAWRVLARLDALAPRHETPPRGRQSASGPELEAWLRLEGEAEGLFARLAELEAPVAGAARALRRAQTRDTKQRLREILVTQPGCEPRPAGGSGGDLRLFAIDDELWSLARGAEGPDDVLARRASLDGLDLEAVLGEARRARAGRRLGDAGWRRLLTPLAGVLAPLLEAAATARAGGVLRVALHGRLQEVPLLALPDGDGWLGLRLVIARVPASAAPHRAPRAAGAPLVVVDPVGDLRGAADLVPFYRRELPAARLLIGHEATRRAFADAAGDAAWLHVDGHGHYDAAFPELSGLVMADGLLDMPRLAALEVSPSFVNLSGCRTGAWPSTADSGRYGLGGLLVRAGAPWVVASADDLGDALAADFNRAFYRALGAGATPPAAFTAGLAAAAAAHPAAAWSNLELLGHGVDSSRQGGNSSRRELLPWRGQEGGAVDGDEDRRGRESNRQG